MLVSFVIPCYRSAHTIRGVVEELKGAVNAMPGYEAEFVLVNDCSPDDTFEVRCEVLEDPLRAVVQFLDGGIPFNPLAKKDPDTSPEALSNRVGGLGIFMVKKMMDDVSYVYEDGKNTLTLVKNLQ